MEPRFQGEGVITGEYFLVYTKLDTFCYPTVQTAPCYVPSFLAQYRRVMDGRTDRQTGLPSTALAMLEHCGAL